MFPLTSIVFQSILEVSQNQTVFIAVNCSLEFVCDLNYTSTLFCTRLDLYYLMSEFKVIIYSILTTAFLS